MTNLDLLRRFSLCAGLMSFTITSHAKEDIEEVVVLGSTLPGPIVDIKSARTTFDLEAIQEMQPGNIYDVLKTVPGVALTGGPRANGISINIRGFSDNEDVLTIIDGAVKNFEKYRFGSVTLEPELLRELKVSRGPASVIQGSGALGGVIEMETKNASDFLESDDRFGGFIKYGYADSNKEQLYIASAYARPNDNIDLLISGTKRDSSDNTLSNGDTLAFSAANPESILAKIQFTSDIATLGLSFTQTSTEGRELFDTSAFAASVNGQVFRTTEDNTYASYFKIHPETPWIDAILTVAYTDTGVSELGLSNNGDITGREWDFQYDIWSARAHNRSTFQLTPHQQLSIQIGVQGLEEERTTEIISTSGSNSESELSQPSGISTNWGSYAQAEWQWHGLTLTAGYRWDHNKTEVTQQATVDFLQQAKQSDTINHALGLANYRIDYQFESLPIGLFHSYVEAARYPKLDEYFIQGNFSRCRKDSSDGESIITELKGIKEQTHATIEQQQTQATADITNVQAQALAEQNQFASAQQQVLSDYIDSVNSNTVLTPAQKTTFISQAQQITDTYVNVTLPNVTQQNIALRSQQITDSLNQNIAASEQNYINRLAGFGINDVNVDLDTLSVPTRTTLPELYQSTEMCGDLYEPETAKNREWGMRFNHQQLLRGDDSLHLKLSYFETDVSHVLESINTNPNDPTSQPGKEHLSGYELEGSYIFGGWRFDLTYNRMRGDKSGFVLTDNPNSQNAIDAEVYQYQTVDKRDLPADEIALTSRWISPELEWQLGGRISHKASRKALEYIDGSNQPVEKTQSAINEVDLFATWQPLDKSIVRLTINNVTNTKYKLPQGYSAESNEFVLGNYNLGRTVKISLTQYF